LLVLHVNYHKKADIHVYICEPHLPMQSVNLTLRLESQMKVFFSKKKIINLSLEKGTNIDYIHAALKVHVCKITSYCLLNPDIKYVQKYYKSLTWKFSVKTVSSLKTYQPTWVHCKSFKFDLSDLIFSYFVSKFTLVQCNCHQAAKRYWRNYLSAQ